MLGGELRTIAKTRNAAETTSQKTSRKSKWLNIKVPTQDGRKKSEKKAQQIEKSRDHHANCLRNKSSLNSKNMHQRTPTTTEKRRNEETHTNTLKQCNLIFTREEPPKEKKVVRKNVERVERRKAFVEEEQHEEDDDGKNS